MVDSKSLRIRDTDYDEVTLGILTYGANLQCVI